MTRLVEVCPEALSEVRSDVAATRDAVRDTLGPLRHRMVALGVPTGAMDEAQTMADRLGTHVLGTLDPYVARARDLAAMRYDGAFGATLPLVDDPDPFVPASPFTQTALAGRGSALTWSAAPVEEQEADERDTERSRGIDDWFGDRWDDLSGAVSDGVDRVADAATEAWDGILEAGGQVADWWDRTSGDLGGWIDENLDGLRDFIGEHVAVFRVLASVCRVVGWVVVAVGAVLTIALAIIGGMGGAAIGGVFGFGVGAVPAGGAGVVAGLSFGLKVVGVGFTLVSVGDFLDVAADWGEGTIDGQELVQRGTLELGLAVTSLLGAGALGKIVQKTWKHLPASWTRKLEEWLAGAGRRTDDAPSTGAEPSTGTGTAPDGLGEDLDDLRDPDGRGPVAPLDPTGTRRAVDGSGVEHDIRFGAAEVADQANWEHVLDQELRDRGWTRAQFDSLVARPIHTLSPTTLRELVAIRDAMPPVLPTDAVQKIIQPQDALRALGSKAFEDAADDITVMRVDELVAAGKGARYDLNSVSSFVSRVADVSGMDTSRLYRYLGLNYDDTPFAPDESMFSVRFPARDLEIDDTMVTPVNPRAPLDIVRRSQYLPSTDGLSASRFDQIAAITDLDKRAQAWKNLAGELGVEPDVLTDMDRAVSWENPYRGNGWSGDGSEYTPEWKYEQRPQLKDGTEMWVTRPDGTEQIVAIYRNRRWESVTEVR
ncbi:hypothetical protein OMK64_10140 [Cellulomonas fimi]|uniref:hypothetical protein n=1 Tax=Cellulomonas fimi TaxID=1708 RepID=UPI00234E1F20|nr:hypothetical protein [Cellulomonas fimi]MDC7121894.1 hypothetical protein [Cellulomonas fimi]